MMTLVTMLAALVLSGDGNFKQVAPQILDAERKVVPDIWVLDFTFRNPRYIMVDIPGQGRKLIWYMTYQVVNRSGQPRLFLPKFTLVTDKGQSYQDVIMPRAEKAVMAREDPTTPLLNSVTMAAEPIPPTPPESTPIVRRGVVFWDDVDMKAHSFTIFVNGLSNGYVKVEEGENKQPVFRRKTLKLKFDKPGDVYSPDEREIRFAGDPSWIYN